MDSKPVGILKPMTRPDERPRGESHLEQEMGQESQGLATEQGLRISYACSQAWDMRIHKGCPVHAKIRKRHQDIAADLPFHTTSAIHTHRASAEHSPL